MSAVDTWQLSFPPFFTLQKHAETQKKQLEAWCSIVLKHCATRKLQNIDLSNLRSSDLFQNATIDRRASVQLIQAIFDDLHRRGHLHWLDKQCQRALVCPITFAALANAIYNWAQASGNINQVCTFYELTNGDDIGKT